MSRFKERFQEIKGASVPLGVVGAIGIGVGVILAGGNRHDQSLRDPTEPINGSGVHINFKTSDVPDKSTHSEAPHIATPEELDVNLDRTLSWMSNFSDLQVKQAAQDLQSYKSEFDESKTGPLKIVDSGRLGNYPAAVTYSPESKNLVISLGLDEFGDEKFSLVDSAPSLFKANYIYQRAKEDPKKYNTDVGYRLSLVVDAAQATNEAFYSNRINLETTV